MTNYLKKIIFFLIVFCALFISVNASAAVYLEDFTTKTRYLSRSTNASVTCDVKDGSLCFDFSNATDGSSRYAYQRISNAKERLYIEFDYDISENVTLMFTLCNNDTYSIDNTLKHSYMPVSISGGEASIEGMSSPVVCGNKCRLTIDMTADSQKKATIKTYLDGYLCHTATVENFPLEVQSTFEYRIGASVKGSDNSNDTVVKIDNLKILTDEKTIPDLYAGDAEYYFDFGDNRFLKSENAFTFNRVKSVRQIANFTSAEKYCENILAQYNGNDIIKELVSVKNDKITLAPGEVILVETDDNTSSLIKTNYMDTMLWNSLKPLAAKDTIKEGTARAPLPNELKEKLKSLSGIHPRLLATSDDIEKVKIFQEEDAVFDAMYKSLINWKTTHNSSSYLTAPVPDYGKNVNNVASIIYNRAVVWGYLYQTTGNEEYAKNLAYDMLKIASYDDWYYGKENFLITAHIASALAIGYDFTYDYLCKDENAETKETICNAIYNYAIVPALETYRADDETQWNNRPDNWNMICNGGIAVACMAIGDIDTYSEQSAIALNYALRLIQNSFGYFSPEGAWVEGLGYYNYMMTFGTDFITSLYNSFGEDLNFTEFSGFAQSAADFIKLSGSRYIYNYSDSQTYVTNNSPLLSFFGKYFNRYELGFISRNKFEKQYNLVNSGEASEESLTGVYNVKDLIWYSPEFKKTPVNAGKDGYDSIYGIETDTLYAGTGIAALHDDFSENQAFVAANWGNNHDYHTHVDMGSFVYEADGEQWFIDLGLNDYSLADCFNKQYYRLKPEGHNCVVINPDAASLGQVKTARGSIAATSFGSDESWFVMDITSAYSDYVSDYKRLVYLDKSTKGFAVKDKFSLKGTDNEFYWFAHTSADIVLSDDGKSAILTKNGKSLKVVLQGEGSFEVMEAVRLYPSLESLDPDPINTGIKKLAVHRTGLSGDTEITVVAVPNEDVSLPDVSNIEF